MMADILSVRIDDIFGRRDKAQKLMDLEKYYNLEREQILRGF